MKRLIWLAAWVVGAGCGATVLADGKDFDFKDPKGVNAMTFVADSKLEPITGYADGVTGTVKFDPAKPDATTGKITVDATQVTTSNAEMKKVLQGSDWLDTAKHKVVEFNFKKVKNMKAAGDNTWDLEILGDFTCKGVTKEMTIPVKVTYLPGALGQRMQGQQGDLIVLRANFKIGRKDFGIKPDMGPEVVAEDIEIRANVVGTAKK